MTGPESRHDFVAPPHFHWRMGVDSRSLALGRYNRSRLIKDIQNPKGRGKALLTNASAQPTEHPGMSYNRLKNRSQRKNSPLGGKEHELDMTHACWKNGEWKIGNCIMYPKPGIR